MNLSVPEPIANAIKGYVASHPRAGRKNVSELTINLWIAYLRGKGAYLPPLLKSERRERGK